MMRLWESICNTFCNRKGPHFSCWPKYSPIVEVHFQTGDILIKDPPSSLQSPLSKIQTKPLHFHRKSCHPWCLNIHFLKHFSFPANVFTSRLWSTWPWICYDIFDFLSFLCVAHARYSSILAENTPEWLYFSSVGYHTNDHSFYSYFTSLSNLFLPAVFEYFTSYGLNPASEAQNIWFGW